MNARAQVRDAARQYLARGFTPIPIPRGQKRPVLKDWQHFTLTPNEIATKFTSDSNIGVLNGTRSSNLIDIDLDAPEAVAAAKVFLPSTDLVFGRAGKRHSHWEYVVTNDLPITRQYKDCDPSNSMLVELRSSGTQTIWPPSTHPSGEPVEFDGVGGPANVAGDVLRDAVARVAACALLARHWPTAPGSRHDIANAVAGFLLRNGVNEAVAVALVETAAHIAEDKEWQERGKAVRATAKSIAANRPVTGGPTLAELLGDGVIEKLSDWLRLAPGDFVNSVNSVEWSRPIEFDSSMFGPAVPLEAFPRALAGYITEVAESYQAPIDLVALASLGVLAAAAAGRAEVAIGGTHQEQLNLYVAPIAESGERKQCIRALTFPLLEEERRLVAAKAPEIARQKQARAVGEKRLKYLQDVSAKEADPAKREETLTEATQLELALASVSVVPKLVYDDATPEFVAKALEEQGGRIAIVSEEAGNLFEVLAGKYVNGVSSLDVHLKSYDGGTIDVGRITRDRVHVDKPALTILVTPQPIILDRLAEHPDFRERGLVARFVFTLTPSLVGSRPYRNRPIDPDRRAAYAQAFAPIFTLSLPAPTEAPRVLSITGEPLEIWTHFADEVEHAQSDGGRLSGIRDWASKHAGRAARIAGLLHLFEHPHETNPSAETMAAAWAIAQWLEGHALAAFTRMRSDPDQRIARWVLDWIRRYRHEQFTLRGLHQHYRRVERPEDLLPALKILEERDFVRPKAPPSRPGRGRPPSPSFEVNPETHAQNSHKSQNATGRTTAQASKDADSIVGLAS